jgi:hypothetical protein
MLRVLLTIVLPLVLPTALYLLWVRTTQWEEGGGAMRWRALPWLWLAGAGVVLLVVVLYVVTVHFGTSEQGVYVPPRYEGGHVVPGHIEPQAKP